MTSPIKTPGLTYRTTQSKSVICRHLLPGIPKIRPRLPTIRREAHDMATSEASSAAFASRPARLRLEQIFFPFMALLIIAAVLLGFSRTFFLAPLYNYHFPNLLVAVHGVVFASWIALFAIQTSLVAVGRVDLHKKLGLLGAILVGL